MRLAAALELERRVERLDSGLEQVEMYLALSEGSIRGVRQSLSFGRSLGSPMDLDLGDALLESLETMQKELGLAAHAIDEIRRRINDMDSPEKVELHFNDILRLVSVVAVKLSNLDSRVEGLLGKLVNVQANAKVAQLKNELLHHVRCDDSNADRTVDDGWPNRSRWSVPTKPHVRGEGVRTTRLTLASHVRFATRTVSGNRYLPRLGPHVPSFASFAEQMLQRHCILCLRAASPSHSRV